MGIKKENPTYSPDFAISTAPPLEFIRDNDYLRVYKELKARAGELGILITAANYQGVLEEIKENFTPQERRHLPRWHQAFKGALLENGLPKDLVDRGLIDYFFDQTHGAIHSLYILTASAEHGLVRDIDETPGAVAIGHDIAMVIRSNVLEAIAVGHDIGRAAVSEVDKNREETKRSFDLRYTRHAEMGAVMVYLLGERFGLSPWDRRRLYWDVRLHDFAIEEATGGKTGRVVYLTEAGRLMHDMEKLLAAGGRTMDEAVKCYIKRARTMARGSKGWYFMRSDLTREDYHRWKMGLRGFSDNLAGMLTLLKWEKETFFTDFGKKSLETWQENLLPAIIEVANKEKDWVDEVAGEGLYKSPNGQDLVSPGEVQKTLETLQTTPVGEDREYGKAYGLMLYTKEGQSVDPTIALPTKQKLLKEIKRRFEEYHSCLKEKREC